jgi:hypothetical protein
MTVDRSISSSSHAHRGVKRRHAHTGSLQAQALVAIPDGIPAFPG